MGTVYRARQDDLGRDVAIKFVGGGLTSADTIARFRREALAASAVRHRNVVTIHSLGEERGQLFLVMEYVDGSDLQSVIDSARRIPAELALVVLAEAGRGLAAAHETGIIHRDVKPGNILLSRSGDVKVTDFGVARWEGPQTNFQLTRPGVIVGTPDYMSPEQIREEAVDGRTDVYALGVLGFELLTGAPPFAGLSLRDLQDAILGGELRPIDGLERDERRVIEPMLRKALCRDKSQRQASMRRLVEELENALAEVDYVGALLRHQVHVMDQFGKKPVAFARRLARLPRAERLRTYQGMVPALPPRVPESTPRKRAIVRRVLLGVALAGTASITPDRPPGTSRHGREPDGPAVAAGRESITQVALDGDLSAALPGAAVPIKPLADVPPSLPEKADEAFVKLTCSRPGVWYVDHELIAAGEGQLVVAVQPGRATAITVEHPDVFNSHTWMLRVARAETLEVAKYDVPLGTMRVVTRPQIAASVLVDGHATRGETPLRVDVGAGSHVVSVAREGWMVESVAVLDRTDGEAETVGAPSTAGAMVNVVAGHDHKLVFNLRPADVLRDGDGP